MNAKCASCKNFWGSSEELIWDGYSLICKLCPERENMPNIKITAEVDGKIVPLNTISTESFEAIKALEKPKEIPIPIPVARVGHYQGVSSDRRLILKITDSIRRNIINGNSDVLAINLRDGAVNNIWRNADAEYNLRLYENVQPL